LQNVDNVKKIVDSVIKSYPEFRTGGAKKVYTLRIDPFFFFLGLHLIVIRVLNNYLFQFISTHFVNFVEQVVEIRPNIDWNKGDALGYLLNTFGLDTQNDYVLPLYIGDDATDEDAFKVIWDHHMIVASV
jgi:hypothetical protein